ncbi:helix-turn-helix domain-containing protein [Sutcliffiella horikoshii]|nr:helix-turn-helix domain-containing protein [Sutcliffiella horikoshii]
MIFRQISILDYLKDTECILHVYSLLFVTSGEAKLKVDNQTYKMKEHSCIILPPNTPYSLSQIDEYAPLRYYELAFEFGEFKPDLLLGEYVTRNPLKMLAGLERLLEINSDKDSGPLEMIEEQMLFYELLYLVCKERETRKKLKDTKEKIQEAILYIQNHYQDELTREGLAEMVGFSPGYFSQAFKKVVGSSPIDYLNEVRIKKAKEMLITSQHRLKTVANSVGYQDEFYFSRLFKKSTGISPTLYVRKSRTRILNADNSFQGHFQALGISPFATLDYNCENGYQLRIGDSPKKQSINPSAEGMYESLMEIKPDVILCADYDEEKIEMLQKVAPTVIIPWMKYDWREHFMHIGKLIGRGKETKEWLYNYDIKAELASNLIKDKVNHKDKVMIIRIYQDRVTVYGKRNVGNIFYNDLKLKPVDIVAEIPPIQNQYPITFAQLVSYKPDYLFILDSSNSPSQGPLHDITTNKEWFNIPAVRKRQVHFISKYWLDYSPASHIEQLKEVVEFF